MRGTRAKQIQKIIAFTGHNATHDKEGHRLVSQYRRFKKIYTRNKELMLPVVRKLDKARIASNKKDREEAKVK